MIEIVKTDITTLQVDAIVNAANRALRRGGGVCGAIHAAAGPELQEELAERFPEGCPTGSAVATRGYRLPARYVIHAVGPVWNGGDEDEEAELASAYENAFARALELGDARTIAFPAISTGIYGFPKERAARIAIASMRAHEQRFDRIVAALFDDASKALYDRVLASA